MHFGTKIFSTNTESFPIIAEFFDRGLIDYIEIYVVPKVHDLHNFNLFQEIPVIFHGANFGHNFNLAANNKIFKKSIECVRRFVEFLNSDKVIFHPGIMDDRNTCSDTIDNLMLIKDYGIDIILENVPRLGIDNKTTLIGAKFEEFKYIVDQTKVKTCLDIGHAIYSSNFYKIPPIDYLEQFISLNPYIIHFSDGIYENVKDVHLSFREGNFPLEKICKLIPQNCCITIETPKNNFVNLREDLDNLYVLKELLHT